MRNRLFNVMVLLFSLASPASADILDILTGKALTNGNRFAFVPSLTSPEIIAIDTQKNTLADVLSLQHVPGSIVVSERLDLLFATDPENHSVSVINLGTGEVIRTLDIGMRPDAALLNPFDHYVAFGSKDGSVSIWDMVAFREMFRVDGLDSAINLTFSFDGRNLFVVNAPHKLVSVIEMHERAKVAEIYLGGDEDPDAEVSAISRSADGFTGFVSVTSENRVVVLDLVNMTVTQSIPAAREPIRPYSTADNRYVLVPHREGRSLMVLSALSYEVIATIETGLRAREINTGWLDTVAFIMPDDGSQIAVVDLDRLAHTGMIELDGYTDNGLVTSDSRMLFASLVESGTIVAINARNRTIEKLIKTPALQLQGIEIAVSNNMCH